ncbi:hypothetical protein ACS8Y6_04270 [Salinisphaera sp. RV14]|uniref:hypothetical protein n=1 Tax=unclassified Salinisphaera TaxID=2649847 RepID=UPI003F857A5B
MSSRAADFFASTVQPTVTEFLTDVGNTRRGRLAAIVLYHMADYLALAGYKGEDRTVMRDRLDRLNAELITECPDFSLIKDIADASKHAQLSVPKNSVREVSSSAQIKSSPGIFQTSLGEGAFGEAAIVFVVLDNGTQKALAPAIRTVMAMWASKLGAPT